jgi:hypothetical protein
MVFIVEEETLPAKETICDNVTFSVAVPDALSAATTVSEDTLEADGRLVIVVDILNNP